jgi:tetratricopeptide (TPR) repeat protein
LPLRTLLDEDRLDRDQGVTVARDLAAVLAEVHESGVVHEPSTRATSWRERLGGALGPNGRVIVQVIPGVELIVKLQLLYLFGDYDEAARMAEAAEDVAYSTEGMIWDAWRCFYRALTLAARCPSLDTGPREVALRDLQTLLGHMRVWAENSHENFGHRYQLVLAETAAVRGDPGAAMDAYEQAIREAAEHGFVQIEALANECYARFWLRRGNEEVAAVYLRAAERCYARWGASAKLDEMRSRYPHRVLHLPDAASGRHWREAIDLDTVMKAAQVVSGEVG